MPSTAVKLEPIEDDAIKIELIEHCDDIQSLNHKTWLTIPSCHVMLNRKEVESFYCEEIEPKIEPRTFISHDLEFFERNNIEMDIKIENTIQPCYVALSPIRSIIEADKSVQEDHSIRMLDNDDLASDIVHQVKTFECFICKHAVAGVKRLRWHMKAHARYVEPEKPTPKAPLQSVESSDKKLATKKSSNKSPKSFACDKCPIQFAKKVYLTCHRKSHFFKTKVYECYICKVMRTKRLNLKKHMTLHDTREKKFVCDQCPKKYSLQRSLYQHKLSHREKLFECDQCNKKFCTKHSLSKHKKTHADNRRRAFKCKWCVKSFFNKSHLKRHNLTSFCNVLAGAEFECYLCRHVSSTFGALHMHMMKSHTDKPFACNECTKKFVTKDMLALHQRTHNNERKFECRICTHSSCTFRLEAIFLPRMSANIFETRIFSKPPKISQRTGNRKIRMRRMFKDIRTQNIVDYAQTASHRQRKENVSLQRMWEKIYNKIVAISTQNDPPKSPTIQMCS